VIPRNGRAPKAGSAGKNRDFPRMIAFHAIVPRFFAFAKERDLDEKDPAFQASSPKNFRAGLRISLFFVIASD